MLSGSAVYYVHADWRNTPRQLDNAQQQAVWAWDPPPFGGSTPNSNPQNLGTSFTWNARFPGQYWDDESRLFDNYQRTYDPALGRYLESDPIGLDGGINRYIYTDNDPLSFVDPYGFAPVGHHYVPRQVFESYDLSPKAREVFNRSTTGPVEHYFDYGHRRYNKAAADLFRRFLERNKIEPSKMTASQAQDCLNEFKNSDLPEIKDYLDFLKRGGGVFLRIPGPLIICPLCTFLYPGEQNEPSNGA